MYLQENLWIYGKGHKTRAQYIPKNMLDPQEMSSTQKNSATKAIVWLISKSAHSADEIADHFEMSPKLVTRLLEELAEKKVVTVSSNESERYKLSTQYQSLSV